MYDKLLVLCGIQEQMEKFQTLCIARFENSLIQAAVTWKFLKF